VTYQVIALTPSLSKSWADAFTDYDCIKLQIYTSANDDTKKVTHLKQQKS